MNKKQKKVFTRIIVAAVLMVVLSLLPIDGWLKFVLFMIPYLVIGHDILLKAWKGILNRQVFDENFLMAVATIGAILLGDYKEGVAVMLFYQIGELFQSYAVGKSRRNISELMDIRPDYANIEKEDGTLEQVDPDEVEIGSVIVVQPGEKVPIDGVIEEGRTSLNTSALTGAAVWSIYETGTGIYRVLNMPGVPMPSNRAGLATLIWEKAGCPEPQTVKSFSDIDDADLHLRQAASWMEEQGLMDDVKENEFRPYRYVTKLQTCLVWDKAKEKSLIS